MFAIEPTTTFLTIELRHKRLEMHNRILIAKKPYNKLFFILCNTVELVLFHLLETFHHSLVYTEFSNTILSL